MEEIPRIRTTVQPGSRADFASPELEAGQRVDLEGAEQRRR